MFDIGFSELVLIAIVGLLVIGPERLPETIRVTTRWLHNIRRSFENAKREVAQELGVHEIKRQLHNEEVMNVLNEVNGDLRQAQQALSELPYDAGHIQEKNSPDSHNPENSTQENAETKNPDPDHIAKLP